MKTITTINKNFNNSQEIKTSPFATYKNEKVTRYTVDCPRGHFLNDLDKAILLCLNKYLILTSKLLEQALRNIGLENFEQKDLQIQLKFLSQSNFVQKGEFSSPNGKSASKFYILGNRGRGFLNSIGETVILTNYLASLDTIGIKKILSANQFAIFTSSDFNKVKTCQTIFVPDTNEEKRSNIIFRPQSLLFENDQTIIVETIRQEDDWKTHALDKLHRINKVLNNKRKTNIEITNPSLVLICESEEHMHQVIELIANQKLKLNILFTHDTEIYDNPKDCLYEYKPQKKGIFTSFRKNWVA